MQPNETDRSFPQPSRRFDGELLDPLLVEEDFDETVGIVRRFATGNPGFTEERILAHLAANGVILYGTQEDWEELFGEMRSKIVADAANRRIPVRITWVEQRLGEAATYSLIDESTPEATTTSGAVVPDTEAEELRDMTHDEVASDPAEPPNQLDLISAILRATAEGRMRPKDLASVVARKLRIGDVEATGIIDETFSANQLRKERVKGLVFITISNGESEPRRSKPVAKIEVEAPEERLLTEYEVSLAIAVLDKLASGHVSEGQTIKNLEQQLKPTMTREEFRRLLRALDSQRLIRFDNEANYGRARKSPRVHFRGQDTKNRWQANRDGYIGRLRKVKIR